jgi:hypothetical protein
MVGLRGGRRAGVVGLRGGRPARVWCLAWTVVGLAGMPGGCCGRLAGGLSRQGDLVALWAV